jgi:hypothetical protein
MSEAAVEHCKQMISSGQSFHPAIRSMQNNHVLNLRARLKSEPPEAASAQQRRIIILYFVYG